jgi:hypothetical protein
MVNELSSWAVRGGTVDDICVADDDEAVAL